METDNRAAGSPALDDKNLRGMFAGLADRYDLVSLVMSLGRSPFWRSALARRLKIIDPPGRLLDLAAGTGDQIAAAKKVHPGLIVQGLDFTPAMLEKARPKLTRLPPPVPEIILGDARTFPFPEASFDSVSLSFALRNMAPDRDFYRRVLKILKPGGRFLILELCHDPRSSWAWLTGFYLKLVPPVFIRLLASRRSAGCYLSNSILSGPRAAETASELAAAGFTNLRQRLFTFDSVMLVSGDRPL